MCDSVVKKAGTDTKQRVELNIHTKMSGGGSVISTEELVDCAKAQGMSAVAVTDQNSVQASPEFAKLAGRAGIKPIFGATIIRRGFAGEKPFTATLLVKNQTGLKNLYRIISALRSDGENESIATDVLLENRDGLLIGSGGANGSLYRAINEHADGITTEKIAKLYDYFEIEALLDTERERNINRKIADLGKTLGKRTAAISNGHYIDARDKLCLDILYDREDSGIADYNSRLRTAEELTSAFSYLGKDTAYEVVYHNTRKIAEQIGDVAPVPNGFFPPHPEGARESLRRCAAQKAISLYGAPLPKYAANRLEEELGLIEKSDSAMLFVAAQKISEDAAAHGYTTSVRGAAGSSPVVFLTGIGEVNPLVPHYRFPNCCHTEFVTDGSVKSGFDLPGKTCPVCGEHLIRDGHDIPAEVFFGPDGEKYPDIDLNVAPEYKPDAVKCLQMIFGKERVICAGTVHTVSAASAEQCANDYLVEHKIELHKAEKERIIGKTVGVRVSSRYQPGGMFILPEGFEICDFTPVSTNNTTPIPATHFQFHALSDTLVKFDIPEHNTPAFLRLLENSTGIPARDAPLYDDRVMSLFRSPEAPGVTAEAIFCKYGILGLPEFSNSFARMIAEEAKPQSFSDLVQISALALGTNVWQNNARDLIAGGVCTLSDVIATRDDVMNVLLRRGPDKKTAYEITEIVRRGKAKTHLTEAHREAMLSRGVPEWYAESCMKIGYLFPKAQIVSYVINALRIGWYKVYHPTAFYAAYFTVYGTDTVAEAMLRGKEAVAEQILQIRNNGENIAEKGKERYRTLQVAREALCRGIKFLPPGDTQAETCLPEGGNIRLSSRKKNRP